MKHTFKHLGAAALALTLLLSGCSQSAGQTSDQETGEGAGSPDAQALSLVTDIPSAPPEGWDGSMELPEDMQLPEDWGGELPEGAEPPEGWDENMELPEGIEPPTAGDGKSAPPAAAGSGDGSGAAMSKADITGAPLAIVVSCEEGSELDAGLACQTMSVTAQLLGYGTKILTSPTIALNGEKQEEYRQLLGIPEDYSAAAVLLVGYADTSAEETDGATGATERNPLNEQVTYVMAE